MKKLYMHKIIGSSGRNCVLIILFNFTTLSLGFFMINYTDPLEMLNLFQHLSFHNLFYLVHSKVHNEANTCTS